MKHVNVVRRAVLALVALAAGSAAQADFVFGDGKARLSGYGSISAAHVDSDVLDYRSADQVERGADNSGVSFSPDTKAGAQLDYRWSPMFSATAQVQTRSNGKGNWNPSLEWAFVRYDMTPSYAVRLGRIGTQFFLISDFRDVSYANLWVRLPPDVYGQVSTRSFDGADLTYKGNVFDRSLTATVYAGRASSFDGGSKLVLKKLAGFNVTVDATDSLAVRVGYGRADLALKSAATQQVADGYRQVAANPLAPLLGLDPTALSAFADNVDVRNARSSFAGVGFTWDSGTWVASGEYTRRTSDSVVPTSRGMFASVGRRIDRWTPFVLWSRNLNSDEKVNPIPAGLPAPINLLAAGGDAVLRAQERAQRTVAVGVRYDLGKNFALKAQYDWAKLHSPSGFFALDTTEPSQQGQTVRLFGASLDFVF